MYQIKKRKRQELMPLKEYLYITRFTIDNFHPKIKPIVRHVEELLVDNVNIEENADLIHSIIKTFNAELDPISKWYCLKIEHELYKDTSESAKRDLNRFFKLLEDLECDGYYDETEAMEAMVEIDRIFERLYYDGVDNITRKMVRIKIKKKKELTLEEEMDKMDIK